VVVGLFKRFAVINTMLEGRKNSCDVGVWGK
jgi:hypothetical protein